MAHGVVIYLDLLVTLLTLSYIGKLLFDLGSPEEVAVTSDNPKRSLSNQIVRRGSRKAFA